MRLLLKQHQIHKNVSQTLNTEGQIKAGNKSVSFAQIIYVTKFNFDFAIQKINIFIISHI